MAGCRLRLSKVAMRCRAALLPATLFLTCLLSGPAAAADPLRGPWPQPARGAAGADGLETSVPRLAVRGALAAWHHVLTRADGPRSVMYPTASGFLGQAVAKHGMLIGVMMTTDRLLHEWDEQQRAPHIVKYGVRRTYDPVEANDFWWARGAE
jgi:uncharacterized protein